jgi:hypothetical protein
MWVSASWSSYKWRIPRQGQRLLNPAIIRKTVRKSVLDDGKGDEGRAGFSARMVLSQAS